MLNNHLHIWDAVWADEFEAMKAKEAQESKNSIMVGNKRSKDNKHVHSSPTN